MHLVLFCFSSPLCEAASKVKRHPVSVCFYSPLYEADSIKFPIWETLNLATDADSINIAMKRKKAELINLGGSIIINFLRSKTIVEVPPNFFWQGMGGNFFFNTFVSGIKKNWLGVKKLKRKSFFFLWFNIFL